MPIIKDLVCDMTNFYNQYKVMSEISHIHNKDIKIGERTIYSK